MRKTGSHLTPDQQRDIALKQAQLQERADAFQKQAANILQTASDSGDDFWKDTLVRETYVGTEFDEIGEDSEDDKHPSSAEEQDQTQLAGHRSTDGHEDAEYISLHLPSHPGRNWCNRNAAEDLAKAELHLRKGQLNDYLHHI